MNNALRNELAQAIDRHQYEHTGDGRVLFPRSGLFVGGVFASNVNGADTRILPNLFTNEGLTDLLKAYFKQGSAPTAFYLAPFSGNTEPDTTLTGANFATRQTEFTGYNETARVAWTPATPTGPSIDNAASVATFTNNEADATIWGFALLTVQNKSATTGKCIACFKDADPRDNLRVGDKINLQYTISAQDAE